MAVPTSFADLSTTVASNPPSGSENVFPDLDGYLRFIMGALASIYNNTGTNGWVSPYSGTNSAPGLVIVTATTRTMSVNEHAVLTNVAASTVTLPASPAAGDICWITVANGLSTNIVARNSNKIMSLAEDMTLDVTAGTIQLRYINSTIGWSL